MSEGGGVWDRNFPLFILHLSKLFEFLSFFFFITLCGQTSTSWLEAFLLLSLDDFHLYFTLASHCPCHPLPQTCHHCILKIRSASISESCHSQCLGPAIAWVFNPFFFQFSKSPKESSWCKSYPLGKGMYFSLSPKSQNPIKEKW